MKTLLNFIIVFCFLLFISNSEVVSEMPIVLFLLNGTKIDYSIKFKLLDYKTTLSTQVIHQLCKPFNFSKKSCMLFIGYLHSAFVENNITIPYGCYHDKLFTVHVIGDSHANWGVDVFSEYEKHNADEVHLSNNVFKGQLMHSRGYGVLQEHVVRCIRVGDVMVFANGEVDVRAHLHRVIVQQRGSLMSVIRRLVTGYFEYIDRYRRYWGAYHGLADIFPSDNVWIQGVVPSTFVPNLPHIGIPVNGTCKHRMLYTLLLNDELRRRSELMGYHYLDFFSEYVSAVGLMDTRYVDNAVHILTYTESTMKLISGLLLHHRSRLVEF